MKATIKQIKTRKRNYHLYMLRGVIGQIDFILNQCQANSPTYIVPSLRRIRLELYTIFNHVKKDKGGTYVKDSYKSY